MPFPSSPRVVFGQNPISEVICQLRFPTVLDIAASPPAEFQNRIREKYPLFEAGQVAELPKEIPKDVLLLLQRASPLLSSPENVTKKFSTESGSRFISLSSDFVAISESAYTEWQQLRTEINEAKTALEVVYKPSFYSRVGLRYVNTLDLNRLGLAGRDWRTLLNPLFIGPLENATVSPHVSAFNAQTSLDLASLIPGAKATIRSILRSDPDGHKFVLDSDFFVAEKTGANDVIQILDRFNELDGNLFRWLIPRDGDLWRALQPR
jgi:uncharacterized protein (TIGR04255 family)